MRISPGAIAAGSALTVATVLAGCGGSQAPAADITAIDRPSVTTSSAAAPSSSATEAVSLDSDAAVEAAARAYFRALELTVSRVDPAPYNAITTQDCVCREGVVRTISYLREHKWHERPLTTIVRLSITGPTNRQSEVRAQISVDRYPILRSDGQIVRYEGALGQILNLSLRVEAGRWRVYDVRQLS